MLRELLRTVRVRVERQDTLRRNHRRGVQPAAEICWCVPHLLVRTESSKRTKPADKFSSEPS